jgi:ketosteroid isomerase-like protein
VSQDNVAIVRASWEAWRRGDMGALFEFYDPDVEWDMTHSYVPGMGVYQGHDGIREFFREWGGRGHSSTVYVEMPAYWAVYRLRDGRAMRVEIYRDEAEALAAIGLRE